MDKQNSNKQLPGIAGRLSRVSAGLKFFASLGLAALVAVFAFYLGVKLFTVFVLGWDIFCLIMLAQIWSVFVTARAKDIPQLAWKNDENRVMIFIIILVTVLVSLAGILYLIGNQDPAMVNENWHLALSMLGVFLSWFLLHTIFTTHYTHLFYEDKKNFPGKPSGGLEFPGDEEPDFIDLAYFSFVIGMTFQVSDTTISSKMLRRVVLLHSLISFLFNTIIVALTINVIAGLKHG